MVDVETLKEAIFTWHQATNTERDDLVVFAAACEHVACLEGPTDEEVEALAKWEYQDVEGWWERKWEYQDVEGWWERLHERGREIRREKARAALVAVAEARRQK